LIYYYIYKDDDYGTDSIYEFIYSYRDSPYEYFPGFSSSTAINALMKLKNLKDKIASDAIFSSSSDFTLNNLLTQNLLFAKYKNIDDATLNANYYKYPLPGKNENVSASSINGIFAGISNSALSSEKMNDIFQIIQIITSVEFHKKLAIESNGTHYSPITDIYYDENVCKNIDCELLRNIQPAIIPIPNDYKSYGNNVRSSAYEYLYGNKSANEAAYNMETSTEVEYYTIYDDSNYNENEIVPFDMTNVSEECQAVIQKSMACVEKITSNELDVKFEYLESLNVENLCYPSNKDATADKCKTAVRQGLDAVCQVFDDDTCKDFIADDTIVNLINSGKCIKSDDDIMLLGELALLKSTYLLGCKKSDSGNLCPLGKYATTTAIDYAFTNYQTIERIAEQKYYNDNVNEFEVALNFGNDILSLFPVLKDLNSILVDSCSDASCNKNILAIDKMILATKAVYEKGANVDLKKQYPKLLEMYDGYLDNYRNQKCEMVGFSGNSGAATLKKITFSLVIMMVASILILL